MKKTLSAISVALLLSPGAAEAFPIAVSAAGVGVLCTVGFPLVFLAAGALWLYTRKGRNAIQVVCAMIMASLLVCCLHDYSHDKEAKAALFSPADSSYLSPPIPFPFMDAKEQTASSQAVTPAEFMEGIKAGHFHALKISTYPSLFMQSGQVEVEEIWRDKELLIKAVDELGGRVVLVDQYGGIAASVAEAAFKNFGLSVGFLQGGTTALSKFGWGMVDQGFPIGGATVPVPDYRAWIADNPDAYVIGITTDSEFVKDGWLFGDQTLTLSDFIANYRELTLALLGKHVFVVGFETNDTGATHIVVDLLTKAGVEVHYVLPDSDEILVKPAYYEAYPNDSRTVSLEDAERYVLSRPDVEFLDFSERPWPIGVDFLKDRYHRLPMQEVAKGALPAFIASLDPSKVYVGLAFDRRTAYHSLLAGEMLNRRGAAWLGRFTLASSLTAAFFTVEELNPVEERLAYELRNAGASVGYKILGNGTAIAAMYGALFGVTAIFLHRRRPLRNTAWAAMVVVALASVIQGRNDFPQLEWSYWAFTFCNTVALVLVCLAIWRRSQPPIRPFSQFTPELPPKAELLNLAAKRGHRVVGGFVVAPEDMPALEGHRQHAAKYIVRSAMMRESLDHESTAGVYESYVCTADEIAQKSVEVFNAFTREGADGYALIQRYCEAEWYGVIQLQANEKSPIVICEIGSAEAVTAGDGAAQTFEFSLWEASKAPRLIRGAAMALVDLMELGAYSLEIAISRSGRLTILQVNADKPRACAENRLALAAQQLVIEIGSEHPDALSAGIVASLAPGHILAYGHRRFALVTQQWRTRLCLRDDLRALGFGQRIPKAEHLVACVDKYIRGRELVLGCEPCVVAVAKALSDAAHTLGRLNRIASWMLADGNAESWGVSPRYLPSSQVGSLLAENLRPEWLGMPVYPLVGFSVLGTDHSYASEEWPTATIEASSPLVWVKDATSILLGVRLAALAPSINMIINAGKADELMEALKTQHGSWGPFESGSAATLVQHPQTLGAIALNTVGRRGAWRVPVSGVTGRLVTPEVQNGLGILLIDRCSMDYLPLLPSAKAVVARRGAITSHLMQHAAAQGLPVVIGGELPEGIQPGDLVTLTEQGEVVRA